jgi:hypothetical protein
LENFMRPDADPATLAPTERLEEIAAILADGLRRLRDHDAIGVVAVQENPPESGDEDLEAVRAGPLTDHVG